MSYDPETGKYKRVVPWFSMSEWIAVYKLVYSEDPDEKKIGLERMIGWKARCPNLPLGVQCTLGITQVLCEDPDHDAETCESIAREQQLRLIYSTAVMRFLNMMFELRADQELVGTLYMKAAKLNIPEWIINLRHDAAHGISLPDLSLLRAAARFISNWLQEHYWEREMQIVSDWHVTEADIHALSSSERELANIIETWEALSLYELAGFNHMNLIPDNDLMSTISSIHQMLSDDEENKEDNVKQIEINSTKVSTALSLVLKRLVRFFKNTPDTFDKAAVLANSLVNGDFFLPSTSLMRLLYPNGFESESILKQLPQALTNSCSELMSILWNLGVVPALCMKLMSLTANSDETDLRRNIGALWVQKIILSCLKIREARKVLSAMEDRLDRKDTFNNYKESFPNASKKSVFTSVAFAAVGSQRSDLDVGYTWKIFQIPNVLTSLDLVKRSIKQPSKFSSIFLPSLMELTSPPISLKSRELLLGLINVYNGNELSPAEVQEKRIFSVNDLSRSSNTEVGTSSSNDPASSQADSMLAEQQSRWTLSQDYLEWHKCPLGILPWQREQDHMDQEECEGRQQQRTWPKLFMLGEWTRSKNEKAPISGSHCNNGDISLRRTKTGRVTKPYVKPTTPAKVLKVWNHSPRQKAIDILTSF